MAKNTANGHNAPVTKDKPLTIKEKLFVDEYMRTGNGTKAAIYAGYKETYATVQASLLLRKLNVAEEIRKRQEQMTKKSIADAQEVMEYLTRVMRGEERDQFGLDLPIGERTKAAQELAKRTIDLDNKVSGKADNVIQIKLDWGDE